MGSWDEVCSLTSIPLRVGARTVAVPVIQRPEEEVYSHTHEYVPIFRGIRGAYDDYGQIKADDEDVMNLFLSKATSWERHSERRLNVRGDDGYMMINDRRPLWCFIHEDVWDFLIKYQKQVELEHKIFQRDKPSINISDMIKDALNLDGFLSGYAQRLRQLIYFHKYGVDDPSEMLEVLCVHMSMLREALQWVPANAGSGEQWRDPKDALAYHAAVAAALIGEIDDEDE